MNGLRADPRSTTGSVSPRRPGVACPFLLGAACRRCASAGESSPWSSLIVAPSAVVDSCVEDAPCCSRITESGHPRSTRSQRIVSSTIGRVRGRGMDVDGDRRLIDLRGNADGTSNDLAPGEWLIQLAAIPRARPRSSWPSVSYVPSPSHPLNCHAGLAVMVPSQTPYHRSRLRWRTKRAP